MAAEPLRPRSRWSDLFGEARVVAVEALVVGVALALALAASALMLWIF